MVPSQLKIEIREVKTLAERRDFDRVLSKAFMESGIDMKAIATYDGWYQNHRRFVAYLLEEEPVRAAGTGMLAQNKGSGEHAILRFAVEEDLRGRGIAKAIAARIEEEAKEMGLTVLISYCAESLLKYYAKFGYMPVERSDVSPTDEPSWKIQKQL